MKTIISILLLTFSTTLFASGNYITWVDGYSTQHVFIPGMIEDMFQEYTAQASPAPIWGKNTDYVGELAGQDFWERSNYWAESGYPYYECPEFADEDFDDADQVGYDFYWESIRSIHGAGIPIFYLASLTVAIQSNDKNCTYIMNSQRHVFTNSEAPEYLGLLSEDPPQELQ